jgi:uncharacterized protein
MRFTLFATVVCALSVASCNKQDGGMKFVDIGTSPSGGVFNPVGTDIAEVLNNNKGDNDWKAQPKGTKGSQENIRMLEGGDLQLAISNASISYFAFKGESGWDSKHEIRTVATIAPNVAMFITKTGSGIKTIQDLKGKRVICGPEGAGFEMFVEPIIKAHGVEFSDFTKLNTVPNEAVDELQDGKADAAFLGGAVPTPAVVRACREMDIFFVPFDPKAVEQLCNDYPFFEPITIKQDKYEDLKADYNAMNVGSMHLITHAKMDEELIYQITKALFENRDQFTERATELFFTESNAPRNTGTPFHPGAIKFYKEAKIWPEQQKE